MFPTNCTCGALLPSSTSSLLLSLVPAVVDPLRRGLSLLDLARAQAGVDGVRVVHRPRLLSDNGPCYISQELADYLDTHGLTHTRGAPYHPMTQGKIERYHRSMKNVVKLEKYFSPWELECVLGGLRRNVQSQALS